MRTWLLLILLFPLSGWTQTNFVTLLPPTAPMQVIAATDRMVELRLDTTRYTVDIHAGPVQQFSFQWNWARDTNRLANVIPDLSATINLDTAYQRAWRLAFLDVLAWGRLPVATFFRASDNANRSMKQQVYRDFLSDEIPFECSFLSIDIHEVIVIDTEDPNRKAFAFYADNPCTFHHGMFMYLLEFHLDRECPPMTAVSKLGTPVLDHLRLLWIEM